MIITDRGAPAYLLLRHDAYRRLTGGGPTIIDLLDLPGTEEIATEPPRFDVNIFRPAEL